jgi:hypothetical protein
MTVPVAAADLVVPVIVVVVEVMQRGLSAPAPPLERRTKCAPLLNLQKARGPPCSPGRSGCDPAWPCPRPTYQACASRS